MARKQFVQPRKTMEQMAKGFQTARMAKLSGYGGKGGEHTGTAKSAQNALNGMIGYAREYGTPEQLEAVSKMNPAKLRYMYNQGMVNMEEYFAYEPNGIVHLKKARQAIQLTIDRYDMLNKKANELDRARRKARKAKA